MDARHEDGVWGVAFQQPVLLVVTYRDEEVGPALQRVLGALGGPPVQRLAPARLSRAAVARLVGGTAATSAPLYRLTAGNPFFVSEMAAAAGSGDKVPATVVDAVLARVQRLDPVERAALEQLCVAPPGVGASPDQILHRRTAAGDPRSHPAEATHDGEEIPGG